MHNLPHAEFEGVGSAATIGIDVGASGTTAAVVGPRGNILSGPLRFGTPTTQAALLQSLLAVVARFQAAAPHLRAVGVGVSGIVDHTSGKILYAANHQNGNTELRDPLSRASGLPVVLDNDASAAAWSETTVSSGAERVLFLTIGTGLGSGYLRRGELVPDVEFGHLVVEPDGRPCRCGSRGCLEEYVSVRALESAVQQTVDRDPGGDLAKRLAAAGGLTASALIDAALAGDQDVVTVVEQMGVRLGSVVAAVMAPFRVERVVVGGGLSTLGELLLDPMRRTCAAALEPSGFLLTPTIALAEHGKLATVVGAALLAQQLLPEAPTLVVV